MTGRTPPRIVLDATDMTELDEQAAALERDGWNLLDRLTDLPLGVDSIVCRAAITDDRDAADAVLAAAWGAGLLIAIGAAPTATRERLLDDLRRIGPVARSAVRLPGLHPDAHRLLEELAAGRSLAEAARSAYLSRRTADRRLAEARRTLGATSTAEAIARWVRATAQQR